MKLPSRPAVAAVLLASLLAVAAARPAAARGAPRADTLSVVTLNLWHDQHDWPARLARIVRELRALAPDVICLQEVLQHPGLPNQARTLADSLGCAWHFVSVDGPERPKRYGNAILSRHEVLATGGVFLRPLDDWRVAARVRLRVRGREVDVYDTHLHHTPEGGAIRAAQVRDLLAFVDSTRAGGPVVLAGDFNCELGRPELAPLERDWADAFATLHPDVRGAAAATMNPRFAPGVGGIDHVFVPRTGSAATRPVSAAILFREAGADSVWASDHYGVLARFALGKGR